MTTATGTSVYELVCESVKLENGLGNQVLKLSGTIRRAWEAHQALDDPSMDAWRAVWEQARSEHSSAKLAKSIRQAIVKELVKDGMSTPAMAAALNVSVGTAHNDRSNFSTSEKSTGVDGKTRNTGDRKQQPESESYGENADPSINGTVHNSKKTSKLVNSVEHSIDGVKQEFPGAVGDTLERVGDRACEISFSDDPDKSYKHLLSAINDLVAALKEEKR